MAAKKAPQPPRLAPKQAPRPPSTKSIKKGKPMPHLKGPRRGHVKIVDDETKETLVDDAVLTPRQADFVRHYLTNPNATEAAIKAGYGGKHIAKTAHMTMLTPGVAKALAEARAKLAARLEVNAENVVGLLRDVAFADARELCGLHRYGCRYCWGADHRYQFTRAEMERAEAEHAKAQQANAGVGAFDEKGGVGFHAKADANPSCPECFGDGIERPVFHDTRKLSPAAARLYSGVKVTKDGLEVKMNSQDGAVIALARHLGLFDDKLRLGGKVEHDATAELRDFLAARESRLPINRVIAPEAT